MVAPIATIPATADKTRKPASIVRNLHAKTVISVLVMRGRNKAGSWLKLVVPSKHFCRSGVTWPRAKRGGRGDAGARKIQPEGENPPRGPERLAKAMKTMASTRDRRAMAGHFAPLSRIGPALGCCAAAMWRKWGIRSVAAIPELDEDCLSFVIPAKQGIAAAGHEDAR